MISKLTKVDMKQLLHTVFTKIVWIFVVSLVSSIVSMLLSAMVMCVVIFVSGISVEKGMDVFNIMRYLTSVVIFVLLWVNVRIDEKDDDNKAVN